MADWFEAGREGEYVAIAIAVAVSGVGGREVAASGRVDWVRAEGYYGWVGGVRGEVLFVGEEPACQCLLEVGDACEGGYVREVEVGEAHFDLFLFLYTGLVCRLGTVVVSRVGGVFALYSEEGV